LSPFEGQCAGHATITRAGKAQRDHPPANQRRQAMPVIDGRRSERAPATSRDQKVPLRRQRTDTEPEGANCGFHAFPRRRPCEGRPNPRPIDVDLGRRRHQSSTQPTALCNDASPRGWCLPGSIEGASGKEFGVSVVQFAASPAVRTSCGLRNLNRHHRQTGHRWRSCRPCGGPRTRLGSRRPRRLQWCGRSCG